MKNYQGNIIEESLEDKSVLKGLKILSTEVEKVTLEHHTPHLKQWTLHTVEIENTKADEIAKLLSKSLKNKPPHDNWYADFKNNTTHWIIFKNKVFKIDRTSKDQYDKATKYGISVGIPKHQVDFAPEVKVWQR